MRKNTYIAFLCLLGAFHAPLAHAQITPEQTTVTLTKNNETSTSFTLQTTVGSLTFADLGKDGIQELLVGTGYGTKNAVIVLRKDGSEIGRFIPYAETFSGGVSVATCDVNNDGTQEIITGAGFGGGPHIRGFTNAGTPIDINFFAYDKEFLGGVNVLCTDITQDGIPDIITAPGPTGGAHIKIFSLNGTLTSELVLPNEKKNTGATIIQSPTAPNTLFALPAAYDIPTQSEITYTKNHLVLVTQKQIQTEEGVFSFTQKNNNISEEQALITDDSIKESEDAWYASAPKASPLTTNADAQFIQVDLSTQTLTAYEYGIPAFSFLVSTGTKYYPTPQGVTTVSAKLPIHDYSWFYGANDPRNYALPNVKWNLRFRNHYYIHSAYWHNNFGTPMSHGCVNTSIPDGEKIFAWANIGTVVEVIE